RNVISGNLGDAIDIEGVGPNPSGNLVQGNFIGTDWTGTLNRGNSLSGVSSDLATFTTVGGAAPGSGNVISGNLAGVDLTRGDHNVVQGNLIGTDAGGTMPLGNRYEGVFAGFFEQIDLIGGTTSSAANTISFNGLAGIGVTHLSGQ